MVMAAHGHAPPTRSVGQDQDADLASRSLKHTISSGRMESLSVFGMSAPRARHPGGNARFPVAVRNGLSLRYVVPIPATQLCRRLRQQTALAAAGPSDMWLLDELRALEAVFRIASRRGLQPGI